MSFFISYRRSDTQPVADRVYEHLTSAFGRKSIFKDVDSISGGADVSSAIRSAILESRALIALIGSDWVSKSSPSAESRLSNPDDFVRLELETALRNSIPIIPVLVADAQLPDASELPPSLQQICSLNALRLRYDPDFAEDIQKLQRHLRPFVSSKLRSAIWLRRLTPVFAIALVLGILVPFLTRDQGSTPQAPPPPETPSERTDLVIQLGQTASLDGRLFAQKFYTSADDPTYQGRTAFLPIVVSERMLIFQFSNLDLGFLPGEPPGPSDRIELMFHDPSLLTKHEQNEGKRARVQGSLVMDNYDRLLPVKFAVTHLQILEDDESSP